MKNKFTKEDFESLDIWKDLHEQPCTVQHALDYLKQRYLNGKQTTKYIFLVNNGTGKELALETKKPSNDNYQNFFERKATKFNYS